MFKKVLLGISLAIFVVTIKAGKEDEECLDELHLNKDLINQLYNIKPLPEEEPMFANYLNCLYSKRGIITDNGFDWDKFAAVFFEDVIEIHRPYKSVRRDMLKKAVDQVVNACKEKNIQGTTQGQIAIKIKNCIQVELDKVYAQYHQHKN